MSALPVVHTPVASPRRSNGLYTYEIRPIGPVITVTSEAAAEEMTMTAALVRLDGSSRRQTLRICPTDRQPDLVARVRQRLQDGAPIRMVVRFERLVRIEDDKPHMFVHAIAETLLDVVHPVSAVQLDLFG